MIFFIALGVLGLLFFLGSLLVGGDHDFGHHDGSVGDHDGGNGQSIISIFTISWFMVGFGGTGTLMRVNDFGMPVSTISALLVGACCLALAFCLMSMLHKQQADSTITLSKLMGTHGVVIMGIPPNGCGKIQCNVAGGTQEYIARSLKNKNLPENTQVKITGEAGGVCIVDITETQGKEKK